MVTKVDGPTQLDCQMRQPAWPPLARPGYHICGPEYRFTEQRLATRRTIRMGTTPCHPPQVPHFLHLTTKPPSGFPPAFLFCCCCWRWSSQGGFMGCLGRSAERG